MDEMHYSKDRNKRVKETAEIFTPPKLVNKMLDDLEFDWENVDNTKTFLDPTCGSGNFLVEIAKRGIHPRNIFGVDLMKDNIEKTKHRLREVYHRQGWTDFERYIDSNILQRDALTYDYSFGEKTGFEDEW